MAVREEMEEAGDTAEGSGTAAVAVAEEIIGGNLEL